MDKRLIALGEWLETVLPEIPVSLSPASADASFRRYFRVRTPADSYIVMDAPPQQEPLDPFVRVGTALLKQGVHAPQIFEMNTDLGFLLLEDLGDQTYLHTLPDNSQSLYREALEALIKIQRGHVDQPEFELPGYHAERLEQEMDLYAEWYLRKLKGLALNDEQQKVWNQTKATLIDCCQQQPQVWVHRDYHSRNLMITSRQSPGVIDFQDMVKGPVSYDLASLFKDCYIRWPRTTQLKWLAQYHALVMDQIPALDFSLGQLIEWYDLTGLQRHLKVLGIFCRLNYRDNKPHYMNDLPLVREYVFEALSMYPDLNNFYLLFKEIEELPDV